MIRVLFVCLGNICRSPMAEGVFQHLVNEADLSEQILVDSAGTAGYHVGEQAHSGTRRTLQAHKIPYGGRARQLDRHDLKTFDYVLAMDASNLSNIERIKPQDSPSTVKLFLDYASGLDEREVPDPYYTGEFEKVYDMVQNAAQGLLQAIRQEHQL